MSEPFDLSVSETAEQIAAGQISPVGLMKSLLARAEALEPKLHVWVTLDHDVAIESAAESERELGRSGPRGPLHGVPIGVKDIFYTRGMKTTACSPIYADFVPAYDATPVALLKKAGAIVMGKTVTTEFACMDPSPTRNPWNDAHTPGGSSSGSAVGVAARIFPAALGSQTAGSVLRPAAYNGVVGFKPTFGLISRHGVFPVAATLDTMGFFTRTVADAAILLGALAARDTRDPSTTDTPLSDYVKAVETAEVSPRIGVLWPMFADKADAEVLRNIDAVLKRIGGSGAAVEEVRTSADFDGLLAAHRVTMDAEGASAHEVDFGARPEDYGPKLTAMLQAGLATPAVRYLKAQEVRGSFRQEMERAVAGYDVLLTPATPAPAPGDLTTTGDPVFQTPWTTCGFPSITIPSGLSEAGLPLGIQLAAAPLAEARLLSAAAWCERALGVFLRPPL